MPSSNMRPVARRIVAAPHRASTDSIVSSTIHTSSARNSGSVIAVVERYSRFGFSAKNAVATNAQRGGISRRASR